MSTSLTFEIARFSIFCLLFVISILTALTCIATLNVKGETENVSLLYIPSLKSNLQSCKTVINKWNTLTLFIYEGLFPTPWIRLTQLNPITVEFSSTNVTFLCNISIKAESFYQNRETNHIRIKKESEILHLFYRFGYNKAIQKDTSGKTKGKNNCPLICFFF